MISWQEFEQQECLTLIPKSLQNAKITQTRMHSIRIGTVCCSSRLLGGGEVSGWGVSAQGCLPGGGICPERGVCPDGGVSPNGLSARHPPVIKLQKV